MNISFLGLNLTFEPSFAIALAIILWQVYRSFLRRLGERAADVVLRILSPRRFGARIYQRLNEPLSGVFGERLESIADIEVSDNRGKSDETWIEFKYEDLDQEEIRNAFARMLGTPALQSVVYLLPKRYETALDIVITEEVMKSLGSDVYEDKSSKAPSKGVLTEYRVLKPLIQNKRSLNFIIQEARRRRKNLTSHQDDNLDQSRQEYIEILKEIQDIDGKAETFTISSYTKFDDITRAIEENDLRRVFLLARGDYISKLNDFVERLEQIEGVRPYERGDSWHDEWQLEGETYTSKMVKMEILAA